MGKFKKAIFVSMFSFALAGFAGQSINFIDIEDNNIYAKESETENQSNEQKEVYIEPTETTLLAPQLDMTFPQETSSDEYNSRILPEVQTSFTSFKDQGYILVTPKETENFDLLSMVNILI